MSGTVVNTTNHNAWFKDVYAKNIGRVYSPIAKANRQIPFLPAEQELGGTYKQPVELDGEQGITLEGANAGAFTINDPIVGSTEFATITGHQIVLSTAIDWETIERTKTSKNAFVSAVNEKVKNMVFSHDLFAEILTFYGKSGLGIIESTGSDANGSYVVITEASWASGIWFRSKNRKIRFATAGGVTIGYANISMTDTNFSTRKIYFDSLPTAAAAGNILYLNTSSVAKEFYGLKSILSNTTGTIFNIDASQNEQWKAAQYDVAGKLSFSKLMEALANVVDKGSEEDVEVRVNNHIFTQLANDQAALRKYDASYDPKKLKNGSQAIEFYYQGGMVSIVSSTFVKVGDAFVTPPLGKVFKKVGSTEKSFRLPGYTYDAQGNGTYLLPMQNNAGCLIRMYSNYGLFTYEMFRCAHLYGITR